MKINLRLLFLYEVLADGRRDYCYHQTDRSYECARYRSDSAEIR